MYFQKSVEVYLTTRSIHRCNQLNLLPSSGFRAPEHCPFSGNAKHSPLFYSSTHHSLVSTSSASMKSLSPRSQMASVLLSPVNIFPVIFLTIGVCITWHIYISNSSCLSLSHSHLDMFTLDTPQKH